MRFVTVSLCCAVSFRFARSFSLGSRSGSFGRLRLLTAATNLPSTSTSKQFKMTVACDDPYLWLEEVESEESLQFARDANEACLKALGDPTGSGTGTYDKVLSVLESSDRIPYASKYGKDDDGNDILMNFWKDSINPKGLWRRTTMESYRTEEPQWETVLDVDELAKTDGISWVWKGPRPLSRARDPMSNNGQTTTRALLSLSRGGSDATHIKEFDLLTNDFVTEDPFNLPEAKTSASYKSRDVLLVGTDTGPGSLTDSGYPRQIREWVRGTEFKDAPVVFEGDKKDVSVSAYINDQRLHGGPIYEIRSRSLTFYTSKYWARKVQYEELLALNDPLREGIAAASDDFVEVDIQDDAEVGFLANMMIISLRSDWEPQAGVKFKQGSLLYVDANKFLFKGIEACEFKILFEPTARTAYENYGITKNYLILTTMDNVKSKIDFFVIDEGGTNLKLVGGDEKAQIHSTSVSPVDPYETDEYWFTTSGYTQPSTLSIADAARIESESGNGSEACVLSQVKALPSQYDATGLEVTQRMAVSKDGTQIPFFLVKKKGVEMNGKTPTLLYGYGGFEISLGPNYIATVGLAWLERGGAYVEANIRGGGEFGPSWHQAALKANRNKSYEDFIAVGEELISSGICKPGTLAIRGGSNGGLLMGNMYTMRPDLFGAIHCAVPLLDMKRYHLLLAGASWVAEYGDPATDDWKFLEQYSPYHNVDDKVQKYPPMLVTTSTRDDRVHPAHARKMVKKLWDMGRSKGKDWPVYYYENIEGGHGGAADAKQSAFMTALAYDFMFSTLTKNVESWK